MKPIERACHVISYILGGGKLRYRVKGRWVEMKGGGMGPFWGYAHFAPFETEEQAEIFAKRWAADDGGEYMPTIK